MQWFIKVGRQFSFKASKPQLLPVCHNEKSVSVINKPALLQNGTILHPLLSLSGQQDTSLKNETIPLKTERLVTLT
jgi:hypothetical protein